MCCQNCFAGPTGHLPATRRFSVEEGPPPSLSAQRPAAPGQGGPRPPRDAVGGRHLPPLHSSFLDSFSQMLNLKCLSFFKKRSFLQNGFCHSSDSCLPP